MRVDAGAVTLQMAWYDKQLGFEGPFVWALDLGDRLIGGCRLHTVDRGDERARYAIGILDRDRLGQGLGAEITNGVLHYAFESVGFHRIALRVLASNRRAIACFRHASIIGVQRLTAHESVRSQAGLVIGVMSIPHRAALTDRNSTVDRPPRAPQARVRDRRGALLARCRLRCAG